MSRFLMVLGLSIVILAADRVSGQEKDQPSPKELQAENARLKEELKALLKEIRRRDDAILVLTKEVKTIRREAVAARNSLQAVKARLEELQELLQLKERLIAALQAAAGKEENPINKRASLVKGSITKVDDKSGLVELDVGSADGIKRNDFLEAFRLRPKAEYLGRVRILEVFEKRSVGRLEMRPGKSRALQVGDSVANRLDKE